MCLFKQQRRACYVRHLPRPIAVAKIAVGGEPMPWTAAFAAERLGGLAACGANGRPRCAVHRIGRALEPSVRGQGSRWHQAEGTARRNVGSAVRVMRNLARPEVFVPIVGMLINVLILSKNGGWEDLCKYNFHFGQVVARGGWSWIKWAEIVSVRN